MHRSFNLKEKSLIGRLVSHFELHKQTIERNAKNLAVLFTDNAQLPKLIHSVKWRVKDPAHLKDKLFRKLAQCKENGKQFEIDESNLFQKINDLAGVRILHLHTSQMADIDAALKELLAQEMYQIIEGPFARTWDDEYRNYFKGIGVQTESSQSMYTSVHYVVQTNQLNPHTAEIQVRTLAEELWGEVNHSMNYPRTTASVACEEQIKVLARITSSCTRLVDSLYKSRSEYASLVEKKRHLVQWEPKAKTKKQPLHKKGSR